MIKLTYLCIFCSIFIFGYGQRYAITEAPNTLGRPWQPQGLPNIQGPFTNFNNVYGDLANRAPAPYPQYNGNIGVQGGPWTNNGPANNGFIPANFKPQGYPANMATYPNPALQNSEYYRKNIAEIFGNHPAQVDQQNGGGAPQYFNPAEQNNDVRPMQGRVPNTRNQGRGFEVPAALPGTNGIISTQLSSPPVNTAAGLRPIDNNLGGGFGVPPSPVATVGTNNGPAISQVASTNRNQVNHPNNNRQQPPTSQGIAGLENLLKKELEKGVESFPVERPQKRRIRYELPTICGQRNPIEDKAGALVHDNKHAKFAEFPWMAAILTCEKIVELDYYTCGGVVIAADVVLTAAHCVKNLTSPQIKIRAGEWSVSSKLEPLPHQERQVSQVIRHEQFDSDVLLNDIAILLLENSLVFQDNVQPICLPNNNENFDRQRCFVSGWGKDKWGRDGQHQDILKKIEVPIIPRLACRDTFRKTALGKRFQLHESFVCAGGEEYKDACNGDGGSPLVCPQRGRFQLAGLVAWGLECGAAEIPGAYVNVAKFVDWIKQHLAEARSLKL